MSHILVKLADYAANNNPHDTLFVCGIWSTHAVILYDEGVKVGVMLHFMFSNSAPSSPKTDDYPSMYADLDIPKLVKSCIELGGRQNALYARLAGGAIMLGKDLAQGVSDGYISAARKFLSKMGINVIAENTAGH